MKKLLRAVVAVTVAMTMFVFVGKAHSDQATADALAPSLAPSFASAPTSATTSATTIGLLPLATTGAIVYFVVVKKNDNGTKPTNNGPDAGGGYVMNEAEAEKWAEWFLRDHSEQLSQDIANGHGPALNAIATMLRVQNDHLAAFGAVMQHDASELLPLMQKNTLTGARAGEFFTRLGDLMRKNPELNGDLAALRAALG